MDLKIGDFVQLTNESKFNYLSYVQEALMQVVVISPSIKVTYISGVPEDLVGKEVWRSGLHLKKVKTCTQERIKWQ